MSISLLIYWIVAKIILAIDSAHIGNGIFDPLISSSEASDSYLSNEMAISIMRSDNPQEETRTHYDGYIFDHNKCIQFNNRVLCGYDKNKGTQLDDYTMLDVGNGCRTRGDRIECGYDNPRHIRNLRYPDIEHKNHHALSVDSHHHEEKHHHKENHHHEENYHHEASRDHEGNHHNLGLHHNDGIRHNEKNHHDQNHNLDESHQYDRYHLHHKINQQNETNHHHVENHHHDLNHHHNQNQHHGQNHHHVDNYHHDKNHHHDVNYHQDEHLYHGENLHHDGNHHHDENHHNDGNHHHGEKHQDVESQHHEGNNGGQLQGYQYTIRQIPTRTAMPTNPTSQPYPSILNRIKSNYLGNKLLKSAFSKLHINLENTNKRSVKTATEPISLSTGRIEPITITNIKPSNLESTLTSRSNQISQSTTNEGTTSKPTRTTSTKNITKTLGTESSGSNDISSDETTSRIVILAPAEEQKSRRLSKMLPTLPKLVSKSIPDGTVVPPIAKNYDTATNNAVLRRKTSSEEKVTTACVEQDDRVVCYDFKT